MSITVSHVTPAAGASHNGASPRTGDPVPGDLHLGDPVSLGAALIAGRKVAPDATLLLMQDHREAMAMFDAHDEQTDPVERAATIRRLFRALQRHMDIEEQIFYPEAARATGRDDLTGHGRHEHDEARGIMARIDTVLARGESTDQTMGELRHAIDHHVKDEEDELFPIVRDSGLDLYALGRRLAARKVALLYRTTDGRVPGIAYEELERRMTDRMNEARRLLVIGLRDMHAAVRLGDEMLKVQLPRLNTLPQMAARLEAHRRDKAAQRTRIEHILDALGEDRSALKDMMMAATGDFATRLNAAKGDEVVRNGVTMFGMAHYEVAWYESLVVLAAEAGETEAARLLAECLAEERAMAAWVGENLRGLLLSHLDARVSGVKDAG